MKLYLAIAAVTLLAIGSCKKNEYDNNPNTNPNTNPNAISYTVNGVSDVKVPSNGGKGTLSLSIALVSGTQETVTLSLSGVPDKVNAEFSSASGTPAFTSTLTLTSNNAAQGTYPITLTGTSASNVKKTVNFNLIVEKPTDCAAAMVGNFTGTMSCGGAPSNTSFITTKHPSDLNTLLIEGLTGTPIPAVLDCGQGTLTLKETTYSQPYGPGTMDTKVTGSGTFVESAHTMTITVTRAITYSMGGSGGTTTCVYTMAK